MSFSLGGLVATELVRIEHAAAVHALLPDAQLLVLPGCTHLQVVGHPPLLTAARAFLG